MKTIFLFYIVVISIISIIITIYDKLAAKNHERRISERTLMTFGLFGGALPMLITMLFIRHKTRHIKFMLGLPSEIIFQIIAFYIIKRIL